MDASLIVMLAALGVFLLLTIVGVITALRRLRSLMRSVRQAQSTLQEQAKTLQTKQEALAEQLARFEQQRDRLSHATAALSAEFSKLGKLLGELEEARAAMRNPLRFLGLP